MKNKLAAVALFLSAAMCCSDSFGFELLDRMLGRSSGCNSCEVDSGCGGGLFSHRDGCGLLSGGCCSGSAVLASGTCDSCESTSYADDSCGPVCGEVADEGCGCNDCGTSGRLFNRGCNNDTFLNRISGGIGGVKCDNAAPACGCEAPVADCGCEAAPVADCGCDAPVADCGCDAAPACGSGGLLGRLLGRGGCGCDNGLIRNQSACGCEAPVADCGCEPAPVADCGCEAAPVADCGCEAAPVTAVAAMQHQLVAVATAADY